MGELLIKPYEISVWEEKLAQDGKGFIETKIAVIGSNTMTGLNKVYDPIFNKKANGEKTLTFSLKYKYFDPYSGADGVVNPFAALLVNERKVKLHYDGEWYEFVVKDHTESSDDYTWTYTCSDAFVLELSKIGYNITFDSELNNNQGTARELAQKTIENTDWRLGGVDSFKQLIEEPVYKGTLVSTAGITIINADEDGTEIPVANTDIYVFYSYIKNKDGNFVQFIVRDDNKQYSIDSKNVITDTNFRITTELTYKEQGNNKGFYLNNTPIISLDDVETRYHVNRLAYNQLTTYDPVMKRTVDRFKMGSREVYRYSDNNYTTSNVVMNYITNGENFSILEDGSLQGWNPYVGGGAATIKKLELVIKPELGTNKPLANLTQLTQVEGFLKAHFNGALARTGNEYENAVFNSGIENNASFIESIAKGQEFVFRWRAGKGSINNLTSANNLGLIVAKYTQDQPTRWGYYYKHIDPNNIILRIEGTPTILNNKITGGHIDLATQQYIIDDVPQTPSTRYIYVTIDDNNIERLYRWDATREAFIETTENSGLPYYYLTGKASKGVTNTTLTSSTEKIGIFIYVTGTGAQGDYFIQDIQLTRCVRDGNNQPVLIGNVPTATANQIDYYYLKPLNGTAAEDVETYGSTTELQSALHSQDAVVPMYNDSSEKYLTISESQSNCFNILQSIAETFECWIDLVVEHDDKGAIVLDSDGKPRKFVYLKEYAGKDNWAGFKYGVNLQSIERTINSDEIVTKLIVDQSQSDYVDKGYVSIADSTSNPSGESYILNFDYYYGQGLLDRESVEADKNKFIELVQQKNVELKTKEKQRENLEASLTSLGSKRNTYAAWIKSAQNEKTKALEKFETLTGEPYETYRARHPNIPPDDQLTEEDTIIDVLSSIYNNSAVINNYAGLATNIETEYWNVRNKLKGSENYYAKIWVVRDSLNERHVYVELNDYLPDFSFIIDGSTYTTTVNLNSFNITTNATSMTFTAPTGYTLSQPSYQINDSKVQKIKITSNKTVIGIEDEIEDLIDAKNELIRDFENKYGRFIQEGTWSSTDYIDSELYYLDALQVSSTSSQPTVSYTIEVVEISQLEDLNGYLFDAGDKTYIEDTEFFGWSNVNGVLTPAREEVIVSEVEWHLDSPDQNVITVQNYKTRFEDFFQRVSATVQTVQYNEATYAKISSLMDANGTLNQNVLLTAMNNIAGKQYPLTSDGSIMIHGDEILIQNLTNTANRVILNSEGIRISSDGGATWATAIDGRGINIGTVYTGMLNTDQVVIGSESNPSFRWDKSGISAYKSNGQATDADGQTINVYDLQTYVRYDQYGLYGIKNNGTFKASSIEDIKDKAHFAITWDGFFIKNSYEGGGRVEITSDNDFRVLNDPTEQGNFSEKIKIGALEWGEGITNPDEAGATELPTLYGIRIKNDAGAEVFKTGDDGNIEITGILNATGGNFSGIVNVGPETQDHIIIDGRNVNNSPSIASSNYQDGAGYGWMINKDGDAVFNNITARGAIKTAVFEYAEIQAVGGIFIFRPSSTIKTAQVSGTDLILTVEKPHLFKVGDWCKVSNYTTDGSEPNVTNILLSNGLTHTYKVVASSGKVVQLQGAAAMVVGASAITDLNSLIGGALVDMGDNLNGNGEVGTSNYGIGVNSSDNTVNLPRRAISLFETVIDETKNPKVSYKYRGILGTLPALQYTGADAQVSQYYHDYLEGTQGIYTDNMYLGDHDQYITFYTDKTTGQKQLKIKANQVMFEVVDEEGQGTGQYQDVTQIEAEGVPGPPGQDGEDAINVVIESNIGNYILRTDTTITLTCTVYSGNTDITAQVTSFTWTKKNQDGSIDANWIPTLASMDGRSILVDASDIQAKAIFVCTVEF